MFFEIMTPRPAKVLRVVAGDGIDLALSDDSSDVEIVDPLSDGADDASEPPSNDASDDGSELDGESCQPSAAGTMFASSSRSFQHPNQPAGPQPSSPVCDWLQQSQTWPLDCTFRDNDPSANEHQGGRENPQLDQQMKQGRKRQFSTGGQSSWPDGLSTATDHCAIAAEPVLSGNAWLQFAAEDSPESMMDSGKGGL